MNRPGVPIIGWLMALALVAQTSSSIRSLEGLGWLEGHWVGEEEGTETEEVWLAPKGGLMVGVHRDLPPSGRPFFEFLQVLETPDGVVFRASPGGGASTDFRLTSLEGERAVFENPEHDFPRRIIYSREKDRLHVRVDGGGEGDGRLLEWQWRRRSGS